jgi:GNAT superfamily N-acetyltransferase
MGAYPTQGDTTIVAEKSGREIGTVTIRRQSRNIFRVESLHVDREHRRQGIGRQLMAAAAEHARDHGAQIRMRLDEGNLAGRAFLVAVGLRQLTGHGGVKAIGLRG